MRISLTKVKDTAGNTRFIRGIVTFDPRKGKKTDYLDEDGAPQPDESIEYVQEVSTQLQKFLAGGPLTGLPGTPSPSEETLKDLLPYWDEMREICEAYERVDFEEVEDDLAPDEMGMTFKDKIK